MARGRHEETRSLTRGHGTWTWWRRAVTLLMAALSVTAMGATTEAAESPTPGGFMESATNGQVRARVKPRLPARGPFTFPQPYNTTGVRLTNADDCGGADCVNYIGYSYWRNTNNHVGSDTMLIFLSLDRQRGGGGPTLLSYDKRTDQVQVVGPLFGADHPLSWSTAEGWYWSASQATKLYANQGSKLVRYDALARTSETVFDVAPRFGSDKYIWQMHSSGDDRVHSATLRTNTNYSTQGCVVYDEAGRQFSFFPSKGDYDECQIDASGRWLVIKENVDGRAGEDNVIIDLQEGGERVFADEAGAGGHSDNGYGYMVAADNWNNLPGAIRVWALGPGSAADDLPAGVLVYRSAGWDSEISHVSHSNARPGVPAGDQYACGSGASRLERPHANEILCFPLDGSLRVLVVAPVMTDLDARGGGDDYAKLPKGNLDVTGRYFIWTSNVGGDRLDAFIVKVPGERLGGVQVSTSAPTIPVSTSTSAPTIEVSMSARTLNAGDVLTVGLTVRNGPTGVPLDLYVGLYLPDDGIAYFSSPGLAGLSDLPSTTPTPMQRVPAGASLTLPRFIEVAVPPGTPPGTYRFFAALVTPGAVSDGVVSESDLAAFELEAFTVAP
jgi:hypothetical protein